MLYLICTEFLIKIRQIILCTNNYSNLLTCMIKTFTLIMSTSNKVNLNDSVFGKL